MKTNYQLQNMAAASQDQAFVDESARLTAVTSSPVAGQFLSSVIGRASIPDLANDFRASLGIERIPMQQAVLLQNEFGPQGQPVYAALNDTRGLIRYVGGWTNRSDTRGTQVSAELDGDYLEVVFYGTGLNLLAITDGATASASVTVAIDGGAAGANILPASMSSVIDDRTCVVNRPIVATPPLALGLHTAKIVFVNCGSVMRIRVHGIEILNPNASGLVNVNTGTGYYRGQKVKNTAADSIAYATGYTPASNANKGARIVRYFTGNDAPTQAVTMVDSSAVYYPNAVDHTNEEVARVYSHREFGSGRNDLKDFSLSDGTDNRAFTLDDGTTSLIGYQNAYVASTGGLHFNSNGAFLTFTFVGCGVDFLRHDTAAGGADTFTYSVDGATPVTFSSTGTGKRFTQKIASGLPYGTHTLKLTRTSASASYDPTVIAFIVYQPKKPSLPSGAVELADYNVMASYVTSTVNGTGISQGVLQKSAIRETVYVGSWTVGGIDQNVAGSHQLYNNSNGAYSEDTFFGTGFEARWRCQNGLGNNVLVYLQNISAGGSLQVLRKTNFPGLTTGSNGGGSFTYDDTGVWVQYDAASVYGSRIYVSGLPLGLYKVKFLNQTSGYMYHEALDIITPIHSYKSNLYADLQNTLPVGSCSLMDSRNVSPQPASLSVPKAWAQAVGVTSGPSTTTSMLSPVPLPDLSVTVKTSGGNLDVSFFTQLYTNGGAAYEMRCMLYIDGLQITPLMQGSNLVTSGGGILMSGSWVVPVAPGVHKVDIYWGIQSGGGTLYATGVNRILSVQEK